MANKPKLDLVVFVVFRTRTHKNENAPGLFLLLTKNMVGVYSELRFFSRTELTHHSFCGEWTCITPQKVDITSKDKSISPKGKRNLSAIKAKSRNLPYCRKQIQGAESLATQDWFQPAYAVPKLALTLLVDSSETTKSVLGPFLFADIDSFLMCVMILKNLNTSIHDQLIRYIGSNSINIKTKERR